MIAKIWYSENEIVYRDWLKNVSLQDKGMY